MTLDQYLESTNESMREFARRSELDIATISRIAAGDQEPSAATAQKIIEASNGKITLPELIKGAA